MSNVPIETLNFQVDPGEHLGRKIYTPKSPEVRAEISKTTAMFREGLGPNSEKFVYFLITEEKPAWPEYITDREPERIEEGMVAFAHGLQDVAQDSPFGLLSYADSRKQNLDREIISEKDFGKKSGIDDQNNVILKELERAAELTDQVIKEIENKFPGEYQQLREKQNGPKNS